MSTAIFKSGLIYRLFSKKSIPFLIPVLLIKFLFFAPGFPESLAFLGLCGICSYLLFLEKDAADFQESVSKRFADQELQASKALSIKDFQDFKDKLEAQIKISDETLRVTSASIQMLKMKEISTRGPESAFKTTPVNKDVTTKKRPW